MFCPKCGKGEQTPNGYCRNCGTFLPDFERKNRAEFGGATPEEQINANLFLNFLTACVSLIMAVLLYATHLGKNQADIPVYVAAAFLLAMSGWQFSTFFIGLKLRRNFRKRRAARDGETAAENKNQFESVKTSELLPEANFENTTQSSVTESTTRILDKTPKK